METDAGAVKAPGTDVTPRPEPEPQPTPQAAPIHDGREFRRMVLRLTTPIVTWPSTINLTASVGGAVRRYDWQKNRDFVLVLSLSRVDVPARR